MTTKYALLNAAVAAAGTAIIVALVYPLTTPQALHAFSQHPVGGVITNAASRFVSATKYLLVPPEDPGPRLADYVPSLAAAYPAGARPAHTQVDWSAQEIWEDPRAAMPFGSDEDLARILFWCNGIGADSAVLQALIARLEARGALLGGVRVARSTDGIRGLWATRDLSAGEVALAVPLRDGLSAGTFSSAVYVSAVTSKWRDADGGDGDLMLDALALAYEAVVRRDRSAWAQYMCTLPRRYDGLPIFASNPHLVGLVSELPGMRRLAAKRRAQVRMFEGLARTAILQLPGGRAAFSRLAVAQPSGGGAAGGKGAPKAHSLWPALWRWAYAAAKTRSADVELPYLVLGAGGWSRSASLGTLEEWVEELGFMLPILDMANHAATGQGANARFQVTEAYGTGAEGEDAAPAGDGSAASSSGEPAAVLVALGAVKAGEQLLFDYKAVEDGEEADQGCDERWVLEYGFAPSEYEPLRDCDTLRITPALAAAALAAMLEDGTVQAASAQQVQPEADGVRELQQHMEGALAGSGLPRQHTLEVRLALLSEEAAGMGQVRGREELLRWLAVAVRGLELQPAARSGASTFGNLGDASDDMVHGGQADGGAGRHAAQHAMGKRHLQYVEEASEGSTREDATGALPQLMLGRMLEKRLEHLQAVEAAAREQQAGAPSELHGALLAVLAGAMRALRRATAIR